MKGKYRGKTVKIVKLTVVKSELITKPYITQVKIEYKENGVVVSNYADANEIEFI